MTDQQTTTTTTPGHDNTTLQQHATAIIQTAAKDVGGVYIRNHFGPLGHQLPESDVQHIAALISTARVTVDWPGSTTTPHCHHTAALERRAVELREQVVAAASDRSEALCRDAYAERDLYAAELDQWQATYGKNALRDAQKILAERDRLADANKTIIGENADLRRRLKALDHTANAQSIDLHAIRQIVEPFREPSAIVPIEMTALAGDVLRILDDPFTAETPEESAAIVDGNLRAMGSAGLVTFDRDPDCGCTPPCGHGTYRTAAGLGSSPRAQEPVVTVHGPAPDAPASLTAAICGLVDAVRRDLAPALARLAPQPEPAAAVDLDELMTSAQIRIQAATNDDERTEIVEDVLSGWYASWPDTAVTDPHWPIARELVRLLTPSADGQALTAVRILATALDRLGARIHRDINLDSSYLDIRGDDPQFADTLAGFADYAAEQLAALDHPAVKALAIRPQAETADADVTTPRGQRDARLVGIVAKALLPWSTGPYGDLALTADRAAGIAVTALAGAWWVSRGIAEEPAQDIVPDPWRPVIEAAVAWRGQWTGAAGPVGGRGQALAAAVDELLHAWPGVDLSVPAVSIAQVAAEGQEPARGVAAVPAPEEYELPAGYVSGCYRCQLGDPHEVHQTAAEEFGQVDPNGFWARPAEQNAGPVDEPAPYDHTLTVCPAGGWHLDHPEDACTPDECPMGWLARTEVTAGTVPPGRYEVGLSDLGDRLLIGGRLDTPEAGQ